MVGVAWVLELSATMMTLCQRLATDFFSSFFYIKLFCFALLCERSIIGTFLLGLKIIFYFFDATTLKFGLQKN